MQRSREGCITCECRVECRADKRSPNNIRLLTRGAVDNSVGICIGARICISVAFSIQARVDTGVGVGVGLGVGLGVGVGVGLGVGVGVGVGLGLGLGIGVGLGRRIIASVGGVGVGVGVGVGIFATPIGSATSGGNYLIVNAHTAPNGQLAARRDSSVSLQSKETEAPELSIENNPLSPGKPPSRKHNHQIVLTTMLPQ